LSRRPRLYQSCSDKEEEEEEEEKKKKRRRRRRRRRRMKKKRMKWADHFKWKDIVEKAKSISEL